MEIDDITTNLLVTLVGIVIVFGSVLFHELAHLIMANILGYTSKEVVLYPLGGLTKIKESIKTSRDELLISSIGPISNFILAGLIYFALFSSYFDDIIIYGFPMNVFLTIVANFNIILGLFNLFIPVLPLDGGRTLKALLTFFLPFSTAIKISAYISMLFAFILVLLGFLFDPFLLFIGVITLFTSFYIPKYSMIEYYFNNFEIGQELTEEQPTVPGTMILHYVYEKMIAENRTNYMIIDESNTFQGLVLKDDIKRIEPIYRLTVTAKEIKRTRIQ
jgi:Zn-dependent protease